MTNAEWHKTACVLCSANCGLEVRLDGRRITRVRGNKSHVASAGYTCEKGLRIDHYQNNRSRISRPLRRRADGTYEEIDWDTAIAEVAAGLRRVADEHGGDTILYYGGGGQGNHLCGAYATALRRTLGITRRSNALAQEKTGEAWVEGRLFGAHTHGEFGDTRVAVFLGKNPWQSHGFDQARRILKEMAADPERTLVVIDPRLSETAAMADLWLRPRPGTDAYLLAAVIAVIVDEGLVDRSFCEERASGFDEVVAAFADVPVDEFARRCGVERAAIEDFARLLAGAESASFYEDLGVEMAPHSTLVSYLQRLCWLLTGHFGRPGCAAPHTTLAPVFNYSASGAEPPTPVTGSPVISGLIACNEIADTILTDHPDRTRALFIESANPVHSLAGSERFRQAMRAAEFSVVVDVAFTETAREADYVLPAASQYEKAETTFFSAGFPENRAWVRRALFDPLGESLPEAEIHRRLIRALGVYGDDDVAPLHEAATAGLETYAAAFVGLAAERPDLAAAGAVVVYETLGPTLPPGLAEAAVLWISAHQLARRHPDAVRAAGHVGDGPALGNALFEALVSSPDGIVTTRHEHRDAWSLLGTDDGLVHLAIGELLAEVGRLSEAPERYTDDEYPFVLSAGERRSFTANTIIRDPAWRKRDPEGVLRIHPDDAATVGITDGGRVRVTTRAGSAVAVAGLDDGMYPGHVSLPNGLGLDYAPAGGGAEVVGVAPNELTSTDWRDPIAGTPWHKYVPARLEAVAP